jgi:glutathione S-transferase
MKREPAPPSTSPYGDYDTMLKTLFDQFEQGPYLLGERFIAADVLWGTALRWTTMFKLVAETPVVKATSSASPRARRRRAQRRRTRKFSRRAGSEGRHRLRGSP